MSSPNQARKTPILTGVVLMVVILALAGYFLTSKKANSSLELKNTVSTPTGYLNPTQTPNLIAGDLVFPFVRDGSIYLYGEGREELLIPAAKESTHENRNDNAYPFLSPNGKYIAYIEYSQGSGFVPDGTLKIYTVDTKEVRSTNFKTQYFHWNVFNELEFESETEVKNKDGKSIDRSASTITFTVLDPSSLQVVSSKTIPSQDRDERGIGDSPLFSDKKYIQFKNNGYYLDNLKEDKETLLFEKSGFYQFTGWSPDGRYAIFLRMKQNSDDIWISVDTDDPKLSKTEITIPYGVGGAGGDVSTGLKWYFNQGFVPYCMESIFFVDNKEPLELTHSSGGGCHNEEGFVATSPNGEFAFVKFDDRFELHTKSGKKKIINETIPLRKTRSTPKNLVWLDNNHMIIFEDTFGPDSGNPEEPKIFLFTREKNTIEPLVTNGYLSTYSAGVP